MINLAICGVNEVPGFANANLTDMVSIGDPDRPEICTPQPPPDFTLFPSTKIHRLEFQDVSHVCETGPTKEYVQRIIDLADEFIARKSDVSVLFHCQAGIARSTASAFILCVRAGFTYQQAYNHIMMVRGILNPNMLMMKYADILMKQDGKMLEFIVKNRWGGPDPNALEWARQHGYNF